MRVDASAGVKWDLPITGIGTHLTVIFSLFVLVIAIITSPHSIMNTSAATQSMGTIWPKLKPKPNFPSHNFDFFALILTQRHILILRFIPYTWWVFSIFFLPKSVTFFTLLPWTLMAFIIVEVAHTEMFVLKLAVPTTANREKSCIATNPLFTAPCFYQR